MLTVSRILTLICAAFLCIDWIGFGSMHFLFKNASIAQVPLYIPFKEAIVAITGVIEIAIGVLVLFPRTRRAAALISLALLILYVPAVYYMLTDDAALPLPLERKEFFRNYLVLHNSLLALASLYLLRSGDAMKMKPQAA